MMRESLDANSKFVDMVLQTGAGAVSDYRGSVGGNAANGGTLSAVTARQKLLTETDPDGVPIRDGRETIIKFK